ncbi:MAG: tetratricopeptide repeat protein [Actinomycetota bacterium]
MAGAVDLAAVKARSEAAARAAEAPAPAAGGYVVDVTEASFQAEVLDRSFQVPVLIDLWAEWCQPCKQLSPILEKLATEAAGSWILAKVDADANPRLSQALAVQSIPTVFAVIGGQLVPGFQGALPEAEVREFVSAVLQAGEQAGLGGVAANSAAASAAPAAAAAAGGSVPAADSGAPAPAGSEADGEPEPPGDPRFDAAEEALEAGDFTLAAQRYQAILAAEPANAEAALALRQVHLLDRIGKIDPALVARAESDPDDVQAQLAAADDAIAANDADGALRRLIALVKRLSGDERDVVRQRLLEYFDILGPDDPRVAPARRELASALF